MWRLARTCSRLFRREFAQTRPTSYISDSESVIQKMDEKVFIDPALQGVVVRHLPETLPGSVLEDSLASLFSAAKSDVKVTYTVYGKPAYGIVKLSSEKIQGALKLNKSKFGTAKIYVTSLEQFFAENQPIKGGFDSRRVVVTHLDPFWTETHLLEVLNPLGEVLGLYLPRDYDYPFEIEGAGLDIEKRLPSKFMTFRNSVLTEDDSEPRSHNFLTAAYDYFSSEYETLYSSLQTTLSASDFDQVQGQIYDLWMFTRALKEQLLDKPDAEETRIDDLVNDLVKQPDQAKALEVLLQVRTHGLHYLHGYFQNRGYAYVTFATRKQAEKAIVCGHMFASEGNQLEIIFHRNEPGYIFNGGKISEAILESIKTFENKVDQHAQQKEAALITKATMPLDTHLAKMKGLVDFIGSDQEDDPVVEGRETSYDDALYRKEKINEISLKHYHAKGKIRGKITPREHYMSSDEEYFDDPELGRIDSESKAKAEKQVFDRLRNTEKYAVTVLPLKEIGKSNIDPASIQRRAEEIQRFFNEAIPSVYKSHPELLKTQRFGDHPEVRQVCSKPFNYSLTPSPAAYRDPSERRKFIRSQIRRFVLTMDLGKKAEDDQEEKQENESEKVDGKEETEEMQLTSKLETYTKFTDSEEEAAFNQAEANDPVLQKVKECDIPPEKDDPEAALLFIKKSDLSMSKKILYTGDDLEGYLTELRQKFPEYQFTHESTESGEVYIISTFIKKHKFDAKKVMYLAEKYESQIKAGGDNLEIDPEDQAMFDELSSVKMDHQEAINDLVEQYADIGITKTLDEAMPTLEELKDLKELTLDEMIKEYRRRKAQPVP